MKASETEFKKIIEGPPSSSSPTTSARIRGSKSNGHNSGTILVGLVEDRGVGAPEAAKPTHFIGSMVTIPGILVPQGVAKYVLIDGQQRITTLMLLGSPARPFVRAWGYPPGRDGSR